MKLTKAIIINGIVYLPASLPEGESGFRQCAWCDYFRDHLLDEVDCCASGFYACEAFGEFGIYLRHIGKVEDVVIKEEQP